MFRHMGQGTLSRSDEQFTSSRRHAVPACHRRGRQDHEHHEHGLDEADPREAVRGEQPHLRPENVIVEIVEGTFLVPAERPDEAGTDPEQGAFYYLHNHVFWAKMGLLAAKT